MVSFSLYLLCSDILSRSLVWYHSLCLSCGFFLSRVMSSLYLLCFTILSVTLVFCLLSVSPGDIFLSMPLVCCPSFCTSYVVTFSLNITWVLSVSCVFLGLFITIMWWSSPYLCMVSSVFHMWCPSLCVSCVVTSLTCVVVLCLYLVRWSSVCLLWGVLSVSFVVSFLCFLCGGLLTHMWYPFSVFLVW